MRFVHVLFVSYNAHRVLRPTEGWDAAVSSDRLEFYIWDVDHVVRVEGVVLDVGSGAGAARVVPVLPRALLCTLMTG